MPSPSAAVGIEFPWSSIIYTAESLNSWVHVQISSMQSCCFYAVILHTYSCPLFLG